jgi:2-amino-4-hydroxy-6-hydroxymethyldihydropteridine diphosphokinase
MAEAFIALGGNVGDVQATFTRAIAMVCDGAAVGLLARSANYRTPPFVNAAIAITTSLSPHELLTRTKATERALGRNSARERHWGPRPIDLDILAYDDVELHDSDLTLPHPYMFERAFVLVPLAEIAPDQIIAGIRVRDALARVDAKGIEQLVSP